MSKVFFDHLLDHKKLEKYLKKALTSAEEREEVWHLIDEIVHHKVMECILDELPEKHHKDFVVKLHSEPHSNSIWEYLKDKVRVDIELFVEKEIESVLDEIVKDLKETKNK